MSRILIIEDDERVAGLLKRGLEELGYSASAAYDGQMGLRLYRSFEPDLVVSDIILPKLNGFEVLKQIRANADRRTPVIMLTALGTTDDKLEGFDAGADDYMVKPFDIRELDARIRTLLRRNSTNASGGAQASELCYADLHIDLLGQTVRRGDTEIRLTPKELALLCYMMRNAEKVLTRVEIARAVWNTHFDTGTNFIDVYINYLRKKIDKDFNPKLIHTKTGIGFILSSKE